MGFDVIHVSDSDGVRALRELPGRAGLCPLWEGLLGSPHPVSFSGPPALGQDRSQPIGRPELKTAEVVRRTQTLKLAEWPHWNAPHETARGNAQAWLHHKTWSFPGAARE